MIKYVYVAGPLTPKGPGNHATEYLENVRDMIGYGRALLDLGFCPFIPALDMQLFLCSKGPGFEEILEYSMGWLRRCDAVFDITDEVENRSSGVVAEIQEAERLGIPVFRTVTALMLGRDIEALP